MAGIVNAVSLSASCKRKSEDTPGIDAEITDINQNDSLSEISFGRKLSEVSEEDVKTEQADSDIQVSGTQGKHVHANTSGSLVSTKLPQRITNEELDWLKKKNTEYLNKQKDLRYVKSAEDTQGKQDKSELISVNVPNILNVNDNDPNFNNMPGAQGSLAQGGDPNYSSMPTYTDRTGKPPGDLTFEKHTLPPQIPNQPPVGTSFNTEIMESLSQDLNETMKYQNNINSELLKANKTLISMKHNEEKELENKREKDTYKHLLKNIVKADGLIPEETEIYRGH
jgi:hypothetical protein